MYLPMKLTASLCLLVFVVGQSSATPAVENNPVSHRQPRLGIIKALLPYINLKIKTPFQCNTGKSINGNTIQGTCMSSKDCTNSGGMVDGECAEGYGKCCVFQTECGGTVERNMTYLINNGSFTSGQFSCQYTIKKLKYDKSKKAALLGACQVRLDFEEFNLADPDATTSLCSDDSFEVSSNDNAFGKICGSNAGQHIYLPIGDDDTVATLTFTGSSSSSADRNWRIHTSYIPCSSNMTAPFGCLQYFNSKTDTIKSFNYQAGSSDTLSQIGDLKYSVCVGESANTCGITLSASDTDSFSLSGNASATGVASTDCDNDYIAVLTEDSDGNISNSTKYCGTQLADITTYARPFVIRVRTDNSEPATDIANKGFSLSYNREGC